MWIYVSNVIVFSIGFQTTKTEEVSTLAQKNAHLEAQLKAAKTSLTETESILVSWTLKCFDNVRNLLRMNTREFFFQVNHRRIAGVTLIRDDLEDFGYLYLAEFSPNYSLKYCSNSDIIQRRIVHFWTRGCARAGAFSKKRTKLLMQCAITDLTIAKRILS